MPELRQDPISGRWVIIAGNRAGRPEEYRPAPVARVDIECPFCRGHEHLTALPVVAYGPTDALPHDWEVRVVPNKYPALSSSDAPGLSISMGEAEDDALYRRRN